MFGKNFLGKIKMPKVKLPDVKKMTKGISTKVSDNVKGATRKVKSLNPFKKDKE